MRVKPAERLLSSLLGSLLVVSSTPGSAAAQGSPAVDGVAQAKQSSTTPSNSDGGTVAGPSGWHGVSSASGGAFGTIRLGLGGAYSNTSGVFREADALTQVAGILSIAAVPYQNLELWLNLSGRSAESTETEPRRLQALGDMALGVKGYYQLAPYLSLGAQAEVSLLANTDGDGVGFGAARFSGDALLTSDLTSTIRFPLVIDLNIGAVWDGSPDLAEGPMSEAERFALGIEDYHRVRVGGAIAFPTRYVTPYVEYRAAIPIGYLATPGLVLRNSREVDIAATAAQALVETQAALPSLSAAVRHTIVPGIRAHAAEGLSFDVAVEVGLNRDVVPGLSANLPYNVWVGASYAFDPFHPKERIVVREIPAPQVAASQPKPERKSQKKAVPAPAPKPNLKARVTDRAETPIDGAQITIKGPSAAIWKSDATGWAQAELRAGLYEVHAVAAGYLKTAAKRQIGSDTIVKLRLTRRTPQTTAVLAGDKIQLGAPLQLKAETELKASDKRSLDGLVDLLLNDPDIATLRVAAHTDSRTAPDGPDALTQLQANAIVEYLSSRGIPRGMLNAVGLGSNHPVAPNFTTKGRAKNRRIEFIVVE